MLSREDILNVRDIQVKEIEVPEWGGTVYIRKLTRGQQDEFAKRRFAKTTVKGQDVDMEITMFGHDSWLVAQGVCDSEGKRLLKDADIPELNNKSGDIIGKIAIEIVNFSGMKEDIEVVDKLKN